MIGKLTRSFEYQCKHQDEKLHLSWKLWKKERKLTNCSNAIRFSSVRGKPSMRNLLLSLDSISCWISLTVTSEGTILPSLIVLSIWDLEIWFPSSVEMYLISECANKRFSTTLFHLKLLPMFTVRLYFSP